MNKLEKEEERRHSAKKKNRPGLLKFEGSRFDGASQGRGR